MKHRILIVILISLLVGALSVAFMLYAKNEQNEECVRQTIGGVIDIGDLCRQVENGESE